ncbi:MAG: type 1 glutamine amidotransferase [Roseomonas sp.]|nr:type 1 glutamine amidotransferase [Roseomonas sp.]
MRILVVRNSETAPEGAFGDWLCAQGHELEIVAGCDVTDAQMQAAPLVVMLGSPRGVYEGAAHPWIDAQRAMVAKRLAAKRPTIGICFGAQMMAVAAGGSVGRHADGVFHRGWIGNEEIAEPFLQGPWPRWHGDVIEPPVQATVLARDAGTVQCFALPNAIAVQFHPEATPDIMDNWASLSPPGVVDRDAMRGQGAALFEERRAAREALFAELLRRAGV